LVPETGGNVVTVQHVRDAVVLGVRQTGVELVLETRGADHAAEILTALTGDGYEVARSDSEASAAPST
jgi:threonine dehydratase